MASHTDPITIATSFYGVRLYTITTAAFYTPTSTLLLRYIIRVLCEALNGRFSLSWVQSTKCDKVRVYEEIDVFIERLTHGVHTGNFTSPWLIR